MNKILTKKGSFLLLIFLGVVLVVVFSYIILRVISSLSVFNETLDLDTGKKDEVDIPFPPTDGGAVYYGPEGEIEAYYDPEYYTHEEVKKILEDIERYEEQ
ncbi:MAG: hypothetical protein HY431_02165 [Candidatus Levybacteria bacterium]|nr:hypothetical protein [Candidatus Levybacteria bacterium]